MPMKFDAPFDRRLRAHGIRPLWVARKANLSRPTILRMRKGSLGRAGIRHKSWRHVQRSLGDESRNQSCSGSEARDHEVGTLSRASLNEQMARATNEPASERS